MAYTHKMLPLAAQYDQAAVEKKWQAHWLAAKTYAWNPETPRADSYVIDTGEPHSFSNPSGQVCRIVSAHTPASF